MQNMHEMLHCISIISVVIPVVQRLLYL